MRIAVLFLFLAAASAGCVSVPGDRILAGDFSVAVPEFGRLDPALPIGFTPLPGTQRVFHIRDVLASARRLGLAGEIALVHDVCFEREARPLSENAVREAIAVTLDLSADKIEVVDFLRAPLPLGQLNFPRSQAALSPGRRAGAPPSDAAILWHGTLSPPTGKSYPVWASVRVSIVRSAVVCARSLQKGKSLSAEDFSLAEVRDSPFTEGFVTSADQAKGKVLKIALSGGDRIPLSALQSPVEVVAGETVRVEASSGSAQVRFDAAARTSGRTGETILVANPSTGRVFRAVVTAKGAVTVRTPNPAGAGYR